jgi:hypothetical protein
MAAFVDEKCLTNNKPDVQKIRPAEDSDCGRQLWRVRHPCRSDVNPRALRLRGGHYLRALELDFARLRPQMELWISRVGDYRTEEGRKLLKEHSPIDSADRIQRPLMVM